MMLCYLEDAIDMLMEEDCETREEALETLENYYKGFTREESLELLIRGQVHAHDDERTKEYFDK